MIDSIPVDGSSSTFSNGRLPVWFFTNEQIVHIWKDLPEIPIPSVFGVAGSCDWVFNFAASGKTAIFHLVDNRKLALMTVELKLAILQLFGRNEFRSVFQKKYRVHANMLQRFKNIVSAQTLALLAQQFRNPSKNKGIFNNKKLWYSESWRALHHDNYLAYLDSDACYEQAKLATKNIVLKYGMIQDVLASEKDGSFGMIYLSNLLDSRRYIQKPRELLVCAKQKLAKGGMIVCLTQRVPKKLLSYTNAVHLQPIHIEHHPFRLLQALRGYYQYSIIIVQS